jgi:hypothetical protein
MTVSCTSELNAIILPCCLEKSSPHRDGGDAAPNLSRHPLPRSTERDLTAQAGNLLMTRAATFKVAFSLITLGLSTSSLGFLS